MKNYDRFLHHTNLISEFLIKKYDLNPRATFGEVLDKSKHLNSIINRYYDLLKLYLELRNVLVHKTTVNGALADPSQEVIENIEIIYKELTSPTKISNYLNTSVVSFQMDTSFNEVLKVIYDFNYTFFPIFDDTGIKGLLTSDGVSKGMSKFYKDDIVSLNDIKISELIDIDDNRKNYEIIKPNENIYDVIEKFEKGSSKYGQPLSLLIADGNVKRIEDIKGIITYWDIEKLREKIILK